MKKITAILLSICMLLTSFVVFAEAEATTVLSSVFFASDYQYYWWATPNLFGDSTIETCQPVVDRLANTAYENGHDIETVVIGGDYTQNDSGRDRFDLPHDKEIFGENYEYHYGNTPNYSIEEIEEAVGNYYDGTEFIYLQGNHDPDIGAANSELLSPTGAYEFDDYIVYIMNDQDYVGPRPRGVDEATFEVKYAYRTVPDSMAPVTDPDAKVQETADDLDAYLEGVAETGDARPIFICSHQPVHFSDSDYNGKAHYIFDIVNKWGEELDIVYFFAHTHDDSDEIGGGLSYVAKGDTMKVCDDTLGEKGTFDGTLTFTYMNYGFLAYYAGTNAILSASVIDITADKLIISRYGAKDATLLASYELTRMNEASGKMAVEVSGVEVEDKTYDGTAIEVIGAPKAMLDGEEVEIAEWTYTYSDGEAVIDTAPINAGEYTLTVSADDEQYEGGVSIGFTISEREITISPKSEVIKTNEAMPEFELEVKNLLEADGEIADGILSIAVLSTSAADTKTKGTYSIKVENKAEIEAILGDNYTAVFEEATLLIGRKSSGGGSVPEPTPTPTPEPTATPASGDKASIVLTVGGGEVSSFGERKTTDVAPIALKGGNGEEFVMVPARFIAEILEYEVEWSDEEKKVVIQTDSDKYELFINRKTGYKNGIPFEIDVEPMIVDNRTMISTYFAADLLKVDIEWDAETGTITVTPIKGE